MRIKSHWFRSDRPRTPEEIAGAVVFYASPLARCVTGTALPVNGGHWMPSSA